MCIRTSFCPPCVVTNLSGENQSRHIYCLPRCRYVQLCAHRAHMTSREVRLSGHLIMEDLFPPLPHRVGHTQTFPWVCRSAHTTLQRGEESIVGVVPELLLKQDSNTLFRRSIELWLAAIDCRLQLGHGMWWQRVGCLYVLYNLEYNGPVFQSWKKLSCTILARLCFWSLLKLYDRKGDRFRSR